jgi:hypothetical protein
LPLKLRFPVPAGYQDNYYCCNARQRRSNAGTSRTRQGHAPAFSFQRQPAPDDTQDYSQQKN